MILDVVYNHFGCEGNYPGNFGPYFTDRYRTPWGTSINYDGPDSDAVRQFAVDNARMWVRDYHLDGLRLDAVQTIYDFGPRHILAEIQSRCRRRLPARAAGAHHRRERPERRPPDTPSRCGGYGLDAVWADDFHHSVHTLLTGERDGYYADFGRGGAPRQGIQRRVRVDGCYSRFRRRRHGGPAGAIDRTRFVVCIQNHDQVEPRRGDRLGSTVAPAAQRLACGLLLLSPCLPLLFMGEEYGETRPFPFFSSFEDPVIIEAVGRGRRREFSDLRNSVAGGDSRSAGSPHVRRGQTHLGLAGGSPPAQLRRLYQDLLLARRRWPALRRPAADGPRLVRNDDSPDGEKDPHRS